MTSVSAFSVIVGRKTAEALNRRRMAILLATLVLLVLAVPIAEVASQARLVLVAATVGFLLASLQQVEAYPRLRLSARLLVLFWLILNLPLPWSDGAWVTAAAAATLAALILSMLWLVARRRAPARCSISASRR